MTRWFRYVPHSAICTYLLWGWEFAADLGPTHGEYSSIWVWPHDYPPPPDRGGPQE